jgi:hypothetical protein
MVGHLFQGRYKAILVQKNAYFLELTRYVVLNPIRVIYRDLTITFIHHRQVVSNLWHFSEPFGLYRKSTTVGRFRAITHQ